MAVAAVGTVQQQQQCRASELGFRDSLTTIDSRRKKEKHTNTLHFAANNEIKSRHHQVSQQLLFSFP